MTSISKNAYIDRLYDIVKRCNNIYYSSNKMELNNVKSSAYMIFVVEIIIVLHFKLMIM